MLCVRACVRYEGWLLWHLVKTCVSLPLQGEEGLARSLCPLFWRGVITGAFAPQPRLYPTRSSCTATADRRVPVARCCCCCTGCVQCHSSIYPFRLEQSAEAKALVAEAEQQVANSRILRSGRPVQRPPSPRRPAAASPAAPRRSNAARTASYPVGGPSGTGAGTAARQASAPMPQVTPLSGRPNPSLFCESRRHSLGRDLDAVPPHRSCLGRTTFYPPFIIVLAFDLHHRKPGPGRGPNCSKT